MKKIILLGDSITAGYKDDHVSQDLTIRLRAKLPSDNYLIRNVGIPGDTTKGALTRLEKHVLNGEPDLVTILFGSNDVLENEHISLTQYRKNIEALIQQIGANKVLLITPSFTNQQLQYEQRPNHRILAYGNAIRELAESYSIKLVDLQAAMLDASDYRQFLQADGVHFNELGYDLLAVELLKKIKI